MNNSMNGLVYLMITVFYVLYICNIYIYIYVYDSQIVHHNPCFNLFLLHNNSFDNQGRKRNK